MATHDDDVGLARDGREREHAERGRKQHKRCKGDLRAAVRAGVCGLVRAGTPTEKKTDAKRMPNGCQICRSLQAGQTLQED
jgi:hypothetical protein